MDGSLTAAGLLAVALVLATLVEWLAERFLPFLKGYQIVLATAALGIILCFAFSVDILALVGFEGAYWGWVGKVVSGIIVGSGSNAIHKFLAPSQKIP